MDEKKEIEKKAKQKNWGPGGGMYRGVNVPVKLLNYIIVILMTILVGVVIFLAFNSHYTVTLDVNGGEPIQPIECKHGDAIDVAEPRKPGYTFAGWFVDQDLTRQWNPKKDVVEQSMTLYASWQANKIMVIFDYDGGNSNIANKEVTFNNKYGNLPVPQKEGYRFGGWQYDNKIITADSIVEMNGEHVLKAVWLSQ